MTMEKFIKQTFKLGFEVKKIGFIPNKTFSKVLKQYKYIDVREYWFDDPDAPDNNTWIDVEGIGYGWLWLGKTENQLRKTLRRWAKNFHNKEEFWRYEWNDMKSYLFILEDQVVEVRLSNSPLSSW